MITIKQALINISQEINEREVEITTMDQKIGDGDHALNLQRGFNAIIKNLNSVDDDPQKIFYYVGSTLMNVVGGTSGAIYGMAFIAGSLVLKEENIWNFENFKKMICTAAKRIHDAGQANLGEKTLYDVWGGIEKDSGVINDTFTLKSKLIAYMEATKTMKATKGRASYLGDRSIGTPDPGAVTSEIILRFLAATV